MESYKPVQDDSANIWCEFTNGYQLTHLRS